MGWGPQDKNTRCLIDGSWLLLVFIPPFNLDSGRFRYTAKLMWNTNNVIVSVKFRDEQRKKDELEQRKGRAIAERREQELLKITQRNEVGYKLS